MTDTTQSMDPMDHFMSLIAQHGEIADVVFEQPVREAKMAGSCVVRQRVNGSLQLQMRVLMNWGNPSVGPCVTTELLTVRPVPGRWEAMGTPVTYGCPVMDGRVVDPAALALLLNGGMIPWMKDGRMHVIRLDFDKPQTARVTN